MGKKIDKNQLTFIEENEEYDAFVEKFKPKKTTDDCYTPPIVYDAIAEYVSKRYSIDREHFIRPFWPDGNYKEQPYFDTDIVVDNPPFSIITEIVRYYVGRGIKFFLFAPALTLMTSGLKEVCYIPCGSAITYENGACVATSFITNLEPDDVLIRVLPDLRKAVDDADEINKAATKRTVPKYVYPDSVLTAAACQYMAGHGVEYTVKKADAYFTRALDAQKRKNKTIFGSGWLLSEKAAAEKAAAEKAAAEKAAAEKAAAEKAAAEKAAAEKWELSEREKQIIKELAQK